MWYQFTLYGVTVTTLPARVLERCPSFFVSTDLLTEEDEDEEEWEVGGTGRGEMSDSFRASLAVTATVTSISESGFYV